MTNDSNTIKENTVTVNGITFYYKTETTRGNLLKGYLNLELRDEKGNSRSMIWKPEDETIEGKITGILESKRWP